MLHADRRLGRISEVIDRVVEQVYTHSGFPHTGTIKITCSEDSYRYAV